MTERKRVCLRSLHVATLALIATLLTISVASYWVSNKFTWPFASSLCQIQIHRGGVFIVWLDYSRGGNVMVNTLWTSEYSDDAYVWPESNVSMWNKQVFFGCAFVGGNGYTAARLPIMLFIMVLMLYSVWWMRHPQRQPRKHVGYCVNCGYDLRGSAGRCPECVQPFPLYALKNVPPPSLSATLLAKPDRSPARPTDGSATPAAASSKPPVAPRTC